MWKIKLASKSEKVPEEQESLSDVEMKVEKSEGNEDPTNSSSKKLKQARLPFQILSPKSSPKRNNDDDKKSKKRRLLVEDSVEVSKTCKIDDIKENYCKSLPRDDVIDNSVQSKEINETRDSDCDVILVDESSVDDVLTSTTEKVKQNALKETQCSSNDVKSVDDVNNVQLESSSKSGIGKFFKCADDSTVSCDQNKGKAKYQIGGVTNKASPKQQATNVKKSFQVKISECNVRKKKNSASSKLNLSKGVGVKKANNSTDNTHCDNHVILIADSPRKDISSKKENKSHESESEVEEKKGITKTEVTPTSKRNRNKKRKQSVDEIEDNSKTKISKIDNSCELSSDCILISDDHDNGAIAKSETVASELPLNKSTTAIDKCSMKKDVKDTTGGKQKTIDFFTKDKKDNPSNLKVGVCLDDTENSNYDEMNKSDDSEEGFRGFNTTPPSVCSTKKSKVSSTGSRERCQLKSRSAVKNDQGSPSPVNNNKTPNQTTPKSQVKRQLTPKQILKQQESEKKRQEKEKEKHEKERIKNEKKEQFNKMKEERQRLKLEKEESKKREKEEKEKKKQIELELKNEEKKVKEEEKKAKDEEKKKREEAKEEERRKRDEAKEEERKKKEAVKKKEEKAASAFASFFTPIRSENKPAPVCVEYIPDVATVTKKFMPFEVKPDMRLAVVLRRTLDSESKDFLDSVLKQQSYDKKRLYIEELKSEKHISLSQGRTWPMFDDSDDDDVIIVSEVVEDNNEEQKEKTCEKKRSHRLRAKLLQFHENRRPPYWGTWRKASSKIGPRTPLIQDNAHFEYDIDSDDEWEEEEPGESLHGSDDEKESEDEYEVDNKVFVPHGYLSDEEGQDEIEDMSPEAQKAKLQFLEREFEAEMKEKTEKLKPRLIGCVWFNNSIEDPKSVGSHIAELLISRRAVVWDNLATPIDIEFSNSHLLPSPTDTPAKAEQTKLSKSNIFPESAVPMLIKLVHGNKYKHNFIVNEFHNYMTSQSTSAAELPSKTAISNKKREISEWMSYAQDDINHPMIGRRCWCVSKEIRKKYGILDETYKDDDAWSYSLEVPLHKVSVSSSPSVDQPVGVPSTAKPMTSITKFTKVLSQEERRKQLKSKSAISISNASGEQKLTPTSVKSSQKLVPSKKSPNVLSIFKKTKSNCKMDPDIIEIDLTPEKKPPEATNVTDDLKVDGAKAAIVNSRSNTTGKPIKRITPICLSPLKCKKISKDK